MHVIGNILWISGFITVFALFATALLSATMPSDSGVATLILFVLAVVCAGGTSSRGFMQWLGFFGVAMISVSTLTYHEEIRRTIKKGRGPKAPPTHEEHRTPV